MIPSRPNRKTRKHVVNLELGPDGRWQTVDIGREGTNLPPRSPAELATLQRLLNVKVPPEYVDVKPGFFEKLRTYEHPPVPGSIGKWWGKGTQRDPYHWVGVSEKLAAYVALGLIAVWGLEAIEMDVSNWWSSSVLNVEQDVRFLAGTFSEPWVSRQVRPGVPPSASPPPSGLGL